MDDVKSFIKNRFNKAEFLFLKKNFREAYLQAIYKNGTRPFVKVYANDGSTLEKSFVEFDQDVKKVSNYLLKNFSEFDTLCTKSDNNYPHLVFIVSILVSQFRFCPLNPNDSTELTNKKIKALGEKTFLLPSLNINVPMVNDLPSKGRTPEEPYIYIFTSGSTGESKIVQQTEAGILTNIEALLKHHKITDKPTVIGTPLPLFHVNALEFSLFCSLLGGHKLILFQSFDPLLSLKSLQNDKIEIFSLVPHLLNGLSPFMGKLKVLILPNFKYFVSAAAPLPFQLLKLYCENNFLILQGYGLSEMVNFSLLTPTDLSPQELLIIAQKFNRPTCGIPIEGNEIKILKDQRPVEEQIIGDIYIRGAGLMLGYKNMTTTEITSDLWLKTGDRGFWLNSPLEYERLYFVSGRVKDIAKKSGITTSLVDFDEQLSCLIHGEVLDAIGFTYEHPFSGEEIGIALQISPKHILNKISLEQQLSKIFDKSNLPALVLTTQNLLRTPSGKPLRWKLTELIIEQNINLKDNFIEVTIKN